MAQLQSNPVWNLIRRANSGDELAMCELEHELQGPNREPILAQVGNLSNQCELAALSAFGDDQKAMTTIVREQMNELRRDLAPTNAIESMIVERIVQCWLQLHLTEMHALHMETPSKELETRIDALNRRYLQSLRTLSIVRKGITKVIKQVSTTIISD